ncbi:unnamed protein product [Vitrella brassicaformis CCMP3155]|uniref:40S ribosomal protein S19 n=1 Tax=Vitrella brassicaformis (strain CCMP3155) TaxID=1169540 RepID=A0A0G4GN85_VITBC|nr:unnamed protein product [Vitrella brassicaformis CCMP3155]|mmetsp:Transcript_36144/g.90188  ORF Transcript_36144/g.90188 Transcript_36144/m.90188 type:complete len:157 (+) Transcript_36144:122-592(+)|eukprot:CEM31652.1 unnamed protein product [Vitrella brassicaformis CCMP3155]
MSDIATLKAIGLKCNVHGVKDVAAETFIHAYAKQLKRSGKLEIPEWAEYVKTSHGRELAPYDPDWLYVRCAAIARRVYIRPGMGVGAFKKVFGVKKRRGAQPGIFTKASGKINRYCLQQLEKMNIVETDQKGGRRITKEGMRELDTIAVQTGGADE